MTRKISRHGPSRQQQQRRSAEPSDGSSEHDEITVEARWQLLQNGWGFPERPEYERPYLGDEEIDNITDRRLMELFTKLTAWANFLAVDVTNAEVIEATLEAKMARHRAFGLVQQFNDGSLEEAKRKRQVTVAKAEQVLDEKLQDLMFDHAVKRAYRKFADTLLANVERDLNLISRELTRRGHHAPHDRRTGRFGV